MGFPGDSVVKNLSLLYMEFISLLYTRIYLLYTVVVGFPGGSAGKESACNAGDPGSIPGSERFPGEGISYPLQYSRASLVAQMVKNPLVMWEAWVQLKNISD